MEALDVLLLWHAFAVRFGLGRFLALDGVAAVILMSASPGCQHSGDDLDLLPNSNKRSRDEVQQPLSRFEDVGVEGIVAQNLCLCQSLEACSSNGFDALATYRQRLV